MNKLFFVYLLFSGMNGFSQTASPASSQNTEAPEGSFHIRKKMVAAEASSSSKEPLSSEILCLIEQKRHASDTTTHIIGPYEIVIYPKQKQK